MHDLIIIGGGAAGLSAGLYGLSKTLDCVTIYEEVGGKAGTQQHLNHQAGAEYLAGAEAVQLFERRVTTHNGAVLRDRVVDLAKSRGIFYVETQHHGMLTARAVVVATGATPIKLDVPGARALLNHGIGYSITSHTQLVEGKPVAVIGTTGRALQGVVELARTAAHIYLIAPDTAGLTTPLARALHRLANVEIMAGYQVAQIDGQSSVEQIALEHDGERFWLKVAAVFADLGLLPNSGIVRRIAQTDAEGFIRVDERNATTLPGLFAAGDVTTAFGENILIAIGDGARAAASAYAYILAHPTLGDAEAAD